VNPILPHVRPETKSVRPSTTAAVQRSRGRLTYGDPGEPVDIRLAEDGTAGASIEPPIRENTYLAVTEFMIRPEHRRRDAGRALLTHVSDRTRRRPRLA
jgi:GNAT superfamily N-acetyltransferase